MGFLKTMVKVAKAVDKAQKAAAREQAIQQRAAGKVLKAAMRESNKNQKNEAKRMKAQEKEATALKEALEEKYKVVNIRLQLDEEYDWTGSHIF